MGRCSDPHERRSLLRESPRNESPSAPPFRINFEVQHRLGGGLPLACLQCLLHDVTPLDAWIPGFRLREIFSETRMKPGIPRDLAYNLRVMGFRGSPVRAERSSQGSKSQTSSRETSEDRRRRPQISRGVQSFFRGADCKVFAETTEPSSVNPAVPIVEVIAPLDVTTSGGVFRSSQKWDVCPFALPIVPVFVPFNDGRFRHPLRQETADRALYQ